jgi:hypothetical protein
LKPQSNAMASAPAAAAAAMEGKFGPLNFNDVTVSTTYLHHARRTERSAVFGQGVNYTAATGRSIASCASHDEIVGE